MNEKLRSLFAKAVESAKPGRLVGSFLRRESDRLVVGGRSFFLQRNCYLIGFGKAVYEMAVAVERVIGDHVREGVLSVPEGSRAAAGGARLASSAVAVVEGAANNLADENAFEAARRIRALVDKCRAGDLLLVLVSGGGSALLPYPTHPVTLAEKMSVVKSVAAAGADIVELNSVRKALSALKGGKLALMAHPAAVVSLILSDVVGDPIDFIASGPTALPYSNPSPKAWSVLEKYRLVESVPENVKLALNSASEYESAASSVDVHNLIIGNNTTSLSAIENEISGSKHGLSVVLTNRVVGLVTDVAKFYGQLVERTCLYLLDEDSAAFIDWLGKIENARSNAFVEDVRTNLKRFALENRCGLLRSGDAGSLFVICGGEPTVRVKGLGKGGRNQELSLRMAVALHELKERRDWMQKLRVHFMSGGTDGIDGPTDAAGAIVDSDSVDEALADGLNANDFLADNDSYNFFSKFRAGSCLMKTGHTGTNVMDVHVIAFSFK